MNKKQMPKSKNRTRKRLRTKAVTYLSITMRPITVITAITKSQTATVARTRMQSEQQHQ